MGLQLHELRLGELVEEHHERITGAAPVAHGFRALDPRDLVRADVDEDVLRGEDGGRRWAGVQYRRRDRFREFPSGRGEEGLVGQALGARPPWVDPPPGSSNVKSTAEALFLTDFRRSSFKADFMKTIL